MRLGGWEEEEEEEEHNVTQLVQSHPHSQSGLDCYLQLINSNPALLGKPLEHWNQKLEAARPMANQ